MRQVYERDVDPTCQRVLLVLCDHANDDGLCWPSIPLIAWKLGASERTVMRSIQRLETSRVITVVRAVGMANHYRIDLSQLPEKSPRPLTKRHPGQNVTRDTGGAEPLTKCPEPLTKCPPTRDIAMSPEPSVNHQENHQGNHQGGARAKRPHALPEDFAPNETDQRFAVEHNFSESAQASELEKFRLHYEAHGKPMKDWHAAWRNWLLKVPDFARAPNGTARASPHGSGKEPTPIARSIKPGEHAAPFDPYGSWGKPKGAD